MLFGTIKNFDEIKGVGLIHPESGPNDLPFEKSAVNWGDATTADSRRLSQAGQQTWTGQIGGRA